MIEHRDALLFADGSMNVFPDGWPMNDIRADREEADRNETDSEKWTKIGRLQIIVHSVILDPRAAPKPEPEIERLRRENAELRERLSKAALHEPVREA